MIKRTLLNFTFHRHYAELSQCRYVNLPESIPKRSLELYIQTGGCCCIAEHEGTLYAFFGTFGGEPDAYYMPRQFIVANPYLNFSKSFTIHEDCVVIPNDSMYMGLMPIFRRYATLLAENDVTMNLTDINIRIMSLLTGNTDRDIASAKQYLEDIKAGRLGVAMTTPFMDGLKTQPYGEVSGKIITQLIELQQYYKASMFNDIGLNSNYNMKRETIVSAEIELNADALFPFVDNMFECRRIAIDEVNEMFGTDIRVELNSSWEDLAEGRELQDIIEEAEAIAAVQVGDVEMESSRLDDYQEEVEEPEAESNEEVESDEEEDAGDNENDTTEEVPQQEEQDDEGKAIEEIKEVLIERIADVVDDGREESLEEVVEEILEDDSSRLESEGDEDAGSQEEEEESE